MGEDKKTKLEPLEVCCFNCQLKKICRIVNGIWHPQFKQNLREAAPLDKQQQFFEGVERMLARICDHYNPEL
jgi:hypothetical protein